MASDQALEIRPTKLNLEITLPGYLENNHDIVFSTVLLVERKSNNLTVEPIGWCVVVNTAAKYHCL